VNTLKGATRMYKGSDACVQPQALAATSELTFSLLRLIAASGRRHRLCRAGLRKSD
jgi:hypothetical protein